MKASKEQAKKLAYLSSDCSFLLTHLIRQKPDEAKRRLKKILAIGGGTPILVAGEVGWYAICSGANCFNPSTATFISITIPKAVCFTESTLAGLKAHRDVFKTNYGLAFDRDFLFSKGANPCLNIRSDIFRTSIKYKSESFDRYIYNFIPKILHPFVNIISEAFDATHEREWRYSGDLCFKIPEILFVFCPENDFQEFSKIQQKGKPVLFDLKWLDRI